MEVNNDLATSTDNAIAVESLRQFINRPIIAIFSDLENPVTEQMLCSLLESLLKRSSTLIPVLIPPFSNDTTNETLEKYAAFTTWLFGTMFYLTCMPSSTVVLSNSIEVQACMLRILSKHHRTMFQTISSEYLNIFDEISEFYARETEEITLSMFYTEKDIIQDLDLTPFPAKIKLSNVPSIYISLLQIIMKTGVSVWDQVKLWDKTTSMIVKSPDLQVEILRLCIEIMKSCTVHDWELMAKITYSLEIVKSLPTWINSNQLVIHLSQLIETWVHLIELLPVSFNVMELCFQIIDFIASEFVTTTEAIKKLMEAACCKIKQYLIEEPKPCTISKAKKLLAYFVHCPVYIIINIYN